MSTISLKKAVTINPKTMASVSTHNSSPEALQAYLLKGVSRTFAFTIPQLPPALCSVVSNQYLLCRIVDTIEDEPALSFEQKYYFSKLFIDALSGNNESARQFTTELELLLSKSTIPAEHELINCVPEVLNITASFSSTQREALQRCIRIMTDGMVKFQRPNDGLGISDLQHLDEYCYYVAGIVGETLTTLFCEYSSEVAKYHSTLMKLSVSFGQGLQMTNILKDIWDDLERGACWLPRSVFFEEGFDLDSLAPHHNSPGFSQAMERLIAIAHEHLKNAVDYSLLLPAKETGLRNFCLWSIGMAVLTLRKIHRHPDFSESGQVKITRRSVKATIITSRLSAPHDALVRAIFKLSYVGLP